MAHTLLRPFTCCEVREHVVLFPTYVIDKTLDHLNRRGCLYHVGIEHCYKKIMAEALTRADSKHPPF